MRTRAPKPDAFRTIPCGRGARGTQSQEAPHTRVRSCFQPRLENSAKTTTRGSRGRLVVCRRGPSARRGAAHGWGVAGGGGGRRRARVRRTHARRRAANSWEVKGPRISETIRCPGSGACWDSPSAERDS